MKVLRAGPDNQRLFREIITPFNVDDWVIEDRNGDRRFRGRLIGMGSSQREDHSHPIDTGATRQIINAQRCTACRWSEIYIFETSGMRDPERYIVYTLGPSVIPGENTRSNVRFASSGFEVVELATVRRGERGSPFLPAAHARALAMAAEVDDAITEAYVNRAVA